MTAHSLWVFAHILLLVYWLGADLGVFLLARAAKRTDLSFAERVFALKMAVTIDITPRMCFALMVPVALHVTDSGGFAAVPGWLLGVAWLIAIAWISLLVAIGKAEGTARAESLNRIHLGFQGLMLIGIGYAGITSLLGHGPLPGGWLAAKVIAFALIFSLSIGIDFAFRPIGPAFARLAAEGSRPDIEQTISAAVDGAIRYVLGLYALLLLIAFLGVTKPF